MSVQVKPGARFRSAVCDVEVIAVKAPSDEVDLRCGGVAMVPMDGERTQTGAPTAGYDGGSLLGKRYTSASGDLELLCTKAGPSSLSLGEELLRVKEAKPLPSSD